jgi:hypothetical protein
MLSAIAECVTSDQRPWVTLGDFTGAALLLKMLHQNDV